ncbi:hypothetical protein HRUBRA_02866 [Pseudohaliea rubra DSM 19751]|uniref:Uncharacterized protein n=1 Tax=Pseudohaliea rubra DSM 19751 TaxID=1265313 RepID=A0A095XSH8_9GAMM|nr:hypothetical protein HRUBRA_02866 [Pseudohaliea rubra DSM 19751]
MPLLIFSLGCGCFDVSAELIDTGNIADVHRGQLKFHSDGPISALARVVERILPGLPDDGVISM